MRKHGMLLGALIASLFWTGLLVGRASGAGGGGSSPRWDYHCIVKGSVGDGSLTQNAKDLGKDGWELAMGISSGLNSGYVLCFKKQL